MITCIRQRGFALIFALILVFIFEVIIMALLSLSNASVRSVRRNSMRQEEFSAAELALNKVYSELRFFLDYGTQDIESAVASINPPQLPEIEFTDFEITSLGSQNELATSGPFIGMNLFTSSYKVELTACSTAPATSLLSHPGVSLRQDIKIRFVPLYIFGIFYDADLEILPGPSFVETGRVHCNGDIYVGSGDSLTFQNYVTSHGDITHGYHEHDTNHTSAQTGSVNYWTGTNSLTDLVSGVYLDHRHTNWGNQSITRWNGRVLDSAHSMPELPLPIPPTENPRVIIEPTHEDDPASVRDIKLNNKADLVIEVNGGTVSGRDSSGNPVNLTWDHDGRASTPRRPIWTLSTFRDNREGRNVTTLDINMGDMISAGLSPDNGILYVDYEGGLRLTNGTTLPTNTAGGFTAATNGPLYVRGNYNTTNTKLALLAGDSVNILSNGWADADGVLALTHANRDASATEVKSVILAGNVPTDENTPYSGGVENYFRFHEDWAGRTFTFRGSVINLWASEVQTANWLYGAPVYTAPNRDWNWDIIYGGLAGPPGMPRVYYIDRQEWQEVNPTT